MAKKKIQPKIEVKLHSYLECLYAYLEQLRREHIQHVLDISFCNKRILKTGDPSTRRNLELERNRYQVEDKDAGEKIRLIHSMIQAEAEKLTQTQLAELLDDLKPRSDEDMVKMAANSYKIALIPYEVNYKFWTSRLLEEKLDQVRDSIKRDVLPSIEDAIKLNEEQLTNALSYLKTLENENNNNNRIN